MGSDRYLFDQTRIFIGARTAPPKPTHCECSVSPFWKQLHGNDPLAHSVNSPCVCFNAWQLFLQRTTRSSPTVETNCFRSQTNADNHYGSSSSPAPRTAPHLHLSRTAPSPAPYLPFSRTVSSPAPHRTSPSPAPHLPLPHHISPSPAPHHKIVSIANQHCGR